MSRHVATVRTRLLTLLVALTACSPQTRAALRGSAASEPSPPRSLGSCSAPERAVTIDPAAKLVVLVHGCNASQGRFAALADLFELHDQQVLCFRYDDRRRVGDVADELLAALAELAPHRARADLTVLGHSQGGLVARAALAHAHRSPLETVRGPLKISLVTVSAPFNGIEAAADCGATWLHAVSLGATLAICRAIAGPKWRDIHPRAKLVQQPGSLARVVASHVEIRTDERNSCRRLSPDGRCAQGDYVFSLAEQHNPKVAADRRVRSDLVAAGHAEIVGREDSPPRKLLTLLQRHGVLDATPANKRVALAALLERLF